MLQILLYYLEREYRNRSRPAPAGQRRPPRARLPGRPGSSRRDRPAGHRSSPSCSAYPSSTSPTDSSGIWVVERPAEPPQPGRPDRSRRRRSPWTTSSEAKRSPRPGANSAYSMPGIGAVALDASDRRILRPQGLARPIGSLTQIGKIRLGKRTENRVELIKDFIGLTGPRRHGLRRMGRLPRHRLRGGGQGQGPEA
ncbi:MAG: hypothetical protein M0C28_38900 [Candidatus Moduliflexus flocculans]|nr:hypothetical protein [Candidatus Moduliflexus flocculans]